MTNYPQVLRVTHPDAEWMMQGDDYADIVWLSDTAKPSQAELDAAWPAVQQARQDAVAAKEAARQSAISKLAALGLTVDEISAAFGLDS